MYYIYALMDIRSNLPFYVGKGTKANVRHEDHFNENINNTSNRHKFYKIDFLRRNGYTIPIKILADGILDEIDAYNIETSYIKQHGRENIDPDGILVNICIDNRPPSWKGKKQSAAHIANRCKSYSATCNTVGRKSLSDLSRELLSEKFKEVGNPFYGKTHSLDFSKEQSERMLGNQYNAGKYIFSSPIGAEYIILGFAKFCRDNNLTISTMEKLLVSGKSSAYGRCKGWLVRKV